MLATAVVAVDAELHVTYLNPAAEAILGCSRRQALGHPLDEVLHPAAELADLCARSLTSGLTFRLREFRCRVANHAVILDCRIGPFEDGSGLLIEFTDTSHDTRLQQEAELIAQQKLSRRIVSQLAHEVKNPLGGMRGSAQLLQKKLVDGPLAVYTKVIIDEVDRLAALVDRILKPGGQPNLVVINPHVITEHVAQLVAAEFPPGITLQRDYDPGLPPFVVDRDQLIQALLNIVRNAMQSLGDEGRIVIRTRAQSNEVIGTQSHRLLILIEVEDNGPGIPEELRETIFYPLVSGKGGGTGLGLTIAQDLVSRHGGLIEVTSKPGQTIFRIRIPVTGEVHTKETEA